MKTADECNQRPPENPVVFAISIPGWIAGVNQPSSLLSLPPKWNEAPKNALAAGKLFNNHFEASLFQHRQELIIDHRDQDLFPAAMPVAALPFMSFQYALHRAAQSQYLSRTRNVLKPHELVVPVAATIPPFKNKVPKAFRVEVDALLEIRAIEMADAQVGVLGGLPDMAKFLVGEFQGGH